MKWDASIQKYYKGRRVAPSLKCLRTTGVVHTEESLRLLLLCYSNTRNSEMGTATLLPDAAHTLLSALHCSGIIVTKGGDEHFMQHMVNLWISLSQEVLEAEYTHVHKRIGIPRFKFMDEKSTNIYQKEQVCILWLIKINCGRCQGGY